MTISESPFPTPGLPEGRFLELPRRGTTFVRELPGPPGAPTLLLLHGWTANSALNWFAAYQPLAGHFRVVALDHRGHGNGIRNSRQFRLDDCADDAAALLDVLGVERAVAVGYSMGGPIAQLLWRRHRDRVAGLVLCSTAARFRDRRGERALRGLATGVSAIIRATPPWIDRRLAEKFLVSKYEDTPLGRWAREQARLNDLRTMVEAGHAVGAFDSRDWIGLVDVPTAVVITERDKTVLPIRQRALADAIDGSVTFLVNGRHDVCATQPELFVPALTAACFDVTGRILDPGPDEAIPTPG